MEVCEAQRMCTSQSKKFSNLINVVIFSKDRACQLDLLLATMREMFAEYFECEIIVLYTCSIGDYEKAYERLKRSYPEVIFIREKNFRKDVVASINPGRELTTFLVDDIVWKEPFSLECEGVRKLEKDPSLICLSLRLDPGLNYCYALDIPMRAPDFDESLSWFWEDEEGDFGYPMSLDGHIFRTCELLPLIEKAEFSNPNILEGKLANRPIDLPRMLCLEKAPIFNMPINKVQAQNNNRHGSIDHRYLNRMFLKGYRIERKPFRGIVVNGCHHEIEVYLERPLIGLLKSWFK